MGFLAVVYQDEKEVDRWPNVEKSPNPRFWRSGTILLQKNERKTCWLIKWGEWWNHLPEDEVPKLLRLLALLE